MCMASMVQVNLPWRSEVSAEKKINEAGSKVEDSEDVSSDAGCEMGACGCCSRGAPVQLPETTMTWAMLGATKRAEMARGWLGKVMGTFGPRRCAGGELGGGPAVPLRRRRKVAKRPPPQSPTSRTSYRRKVPLRFRDIFERRNAPPFKLTSEESLKPSGRAHPCQTTLYL